MANLFFQLGLGGFMIGITVIIHAALMDMIIRQVPVMEKVVRKFFKTVWKPLLSSVIVVTIFFAQIIQIWLWAILYYALDCEPLTDFPQALYFATTTYTTLGYGDIVLEPSYQLLAAIEGANGFLLFGWTTAFIFEIISGIYKAETESL